MQIPSWVFQIRLNAWLCPSVSGIQQEQLRQCITESELKAIVCSQASMKINLLSTLHPPSARRFHRKIKLIQRRAYGFRNFQNYRLRVIAQCG